MTNKMIRDFFSSYNSIKLSEEEYASLLYYFEFRYRFSIDETYFRVYLEILIKGSDKVVSSRTYMVNSNKVSIYGERTLFYHESNIPVMENDAMTYWLINNTSFLEDIERQAEKISNNTIIQYKRDFMSKVKRLATQMHANETSSLEAPVHITPCFAPGYRANISVSLKVARDKEYVVSNISDFIYRVEKHGNYKYGKGLEFVHSLEAFDEVSRSFYLFMKNNVSSRQYGRGNFYIPNEKVEEVISLYKEQYVEIQGERYLVRLNPVPVSVDVDNKYLLHIRMNEESSLLFNSRLLINKKEQCIDILNCDESFGALVNYINESEYPSIEDDITDFKYDFILKYSDRFNFDLSIQDEFLFNDLDIKVYFDMENQIISYKEELYLNGETINSNKLNKFNLMQYDRFNNLLSLFGFENHLLKDQKAVWDFLNSDFTELKKVADVYLSDNITSKNLSSFKIPSIRMNVENNLLDVFLEDSIYSQEELLAILSALKQKKKFILLKDNVINLEDEKAKTFLSHVSDYDLMDNSSIIPQKLPIYYAFKTIDDVHGIDINGKVTEIISDIKDFKQADVNVASIEGELRKYQKEGVKWLTVLYNHGLSGILADDMGLGKTIEIISFIKGIKEKEPILITAPKSLIFNWKNEFEKFHPEQEVVLIYGDKPTRVELIKNIKKNEKVIYITSYDSLRIDEELYEKKKFNLHILDEAQAIKNAQTKKSASVNRIHSNNRFILTGTPIENSVLDLWSLFNFLMPHYFPPINDFKIRYENENGYSTVVKKKIAPFILRRNKKDVLKDLPPKYEVVMTCEMNDEQRKVYDAYRLEAKNLLDSGGTSFDVLSLLTRLRQICIDPSLFIENYTPNSGKIDNLMEIIEEKISQGHRLLVFSQFVKALELVMNKMDAKNISYSVITGSTEGEERVVLASEFNANNKIKVMFVSLKAGGTGLNLIGADTVIHLDPWWNIAAQDQATDRTHRIGQERNVEVIKLICQNSIEQRVVELQNKKKELIKELISDDDKSITSMSLEDIKFMLK